MVRRLLVVEDDDVLRTTIVDALRDEGYEVIAAQDGSHALRLACVVEPEGVVLDLGLPYMDGPAFVTEWRARSAVSGIPIIVMSGRPDVKTVGDGLGAAACLEKPFDLRALVTALFAAVPL